MSSPKRTPLQAQWEQFRTRYDKHYIMAFRLGDFYEFFYDDAKDVSKILDIALTDRQGTPLAGFPYASGQEALEKVVKAGRPVVVVDQVEDPAEAKGRIVERDIVRVITPGTILEDNVLERGSNNYLAALAWFPAEQQQDSIKVAVAFCDISTGEFFTTSYVDSRQRFAALSGDLGRFSPVEVIIPDDARDEGIPAWIAKLLPGTAIRRRSALDFDPVEGHEILAKHFKVTNLESFGIEGNADVIGVAGALLLYLQENQKRSLSNITSSSHRLPANHMQIDHNTVRNLEIVKNSADGSSRGTLFDLFSRTCTAMGMRLMKRLLLSPLMDKLAINARLDFVELLVKDAMLSEELKQEMTGVCDLERLIARINYSSVVNGRHLVQLARSIAQIPAIKRTLAGIDSDFSRRHVTCLADFEPIAKALLGTFVDAPPATTGEGGMIRAGINPELDELRGIRSGSDEWLERFQDEARRRYGLSTLRVKNNSVFGYFIEISKSYVDKVPDSWTRKQTLVNAERYTTPELKAMEEKIVSAEGRIFEIEKGIFLDMKARAVAATGEIQAAARAIAEVDVMLTMAQVAASGSYVRPRIEEGGAMNIREGRHPVIERMIGIDKFISNDVSIDPTDNVLTIVTGPNMSGKSTFLRQVCLIVLLAQVGSFVPAKEASICITDKIFSRVGAQDDISKAKSTFLVEMNETAYILNHATTKSLVILDELGRGTSTFDGLSLAWAVAEYLQARGVKTLFATHYHQLSDLESFLPRTKNLNVLVKEDEKTRDLIFLHKVVPGASDKSYGIQVAKLAGIPGPVIARAEEILKKLSDEDPLTTDRIKLIGERGITSPGPRDARHAMKQKTVQTILFPILKEQPPDTSLQAVRDELEKVNVETTTPLDALAVLKRLKDAVEQGKK
ncbi:MAG: DNA mismatch repair protein MutS [Candidatus Lokiarchaeota archaeon]|nr:DNA mismatch repair protein MutS [Candidatus Lokiarchaeota archaeon]